MSKVIRGTEKAQLLLHGRKPGLAFGGVFFFERELENPLKSVYVDEFDRHR
jgi:hypothetical protein